MDSRYLAGLFDGDGCVLIEKSVKSCKITSRCYSATYRIRAQITNIHLPTLLRLKEKYGGDIVNCKPHVYMWRVAAKKAYKFLKDISKYVNIKRDQVVVAIKFQESKQVRSIIGGEVKRQLSDMKSERFSFEEITHGQG